MGIPLYMSVCEGIRDRLLFRVCGQSSWYPHNYESEDFTMEVRVLVDFTAR